MNWFYLALLAPIIYAVVNLIDDTLVRSVEKGPALTAGIAGLAGSLPLLSRFFLHANNIPLRLAVYMMIAGFLTPFYYFFYFRALETESPSIVIALFVSLMPATLPIFAHFWLHERLVGLQLVGFLVVLLSSLALSATSIKKFKFSKALWLVLVAVVFLDIISLLTKYSYEQVAFYPAYLYFSVGMGLAGIYLLLVTRFLPKNELVVKAAKKSLKKFAVLFVFSELLNLAAEFVSNLAISRGPVSLVRVIEGTQPIYVLLIALAMYPFFPDYFREASEGKVAKKLALMSISIVGLVLINRA